MVVWWPIFEFIGGAGVVGADSGDVDQSVVDDDGCDETVGVGGFAVTVELADGIVGLVWALAVRVAPVRQRRRTWRRGERRKLLRVEGAVVMGSSW